ncbi:MAG: hypothetical protein JSR55_08455 [Proteobacteria bacterium]|nr:hypothetical protein [Pseudomonadota bacterium]
MMFAPAGANGGTQNHLYLWNMYNRRRVSSVNYDTTTTWNYSTATWRVKNGNANNEISFVCGIAEDSFHAANSTIFSGNGSDIFSACNVGLDSTSAPATSSQGDLDVSITANIDITIRANFFAMPSIGYHFVAPLERGAGSGTSTWKGWRLSSTDLALPFIFDWEM